MKANTVICKKKSTIKSLRKAAGKLDEVWKASTKARAAGNASSVAGGLLTITGGIATAMTWGAASPLLIAGLGIGVAGAGTNLVTSHIEASINSSEFKEAEQKFHDFEDSIKDVKNTIQFWWKTKDVVSLLYICCLAELNQDRNDLAKKFLHNLVLHPLECSTVKPPSSGKKKEKAYKTLAGHATPGVAVQVATGLMSGISPLCLVGNAIDLGFTIKDIVEDKGSEAARCLRQKADELESGFLE